MTNEEINALFAGAWENHERTDFRSILERSLVFVCAYDETRLIGFVNLAWDGGVHGFLLDATVRADFQRRGVGTALVKRAAAIAAERGLKWLHVDFEPHLRSFYSRCGFRKTSAGLIDLRGDEPV